MRSVVAVVRTHRVLAGLLLLPMFLGTLVVWSLADRAERVDRIPAAVVNLDRPVLRKGEPPVAAGRLLAAGLTSPAERSPVNLGWRLTNADDARRGLRDGDYDAVLTIPADFSRTIASLARGGPPRPAAISVVSNDTSSALVSAIGDQVARVSADRLGRRVTTTYLDTVLGRTGRLADRLGTAARGAGRIATGTRRLGRGSATLAEGLGSLADGAARLADGGRRLGAGAARLEDGSDRLADGAARLAVGLGRLSRQTGALPAQAGRLADGAGQVADGTAAYARLLTAWAKACADPLVLARMPELCLTTRQAVGPGGAQARRLTAGARQVADGAERLGAAAPDLVRAVRRAAAGADGLADGSGRLAAGLHSLTAGADRLSSGSARLGAAAGRAAAGAHRLADGSSALEAGSTELSGGLHRGAAALPRYDRQERHDLADVIAAPVRAGARTLAETPDGATQLAPGTIAFALWLGAFATYLVRPGIPSRLRWRALSSARLALAGLRPGVLVGVGQAVLLLGALAALGADLASPLLVLLVMALAAACFAAVNHAFVSVLGRRRGWLWSIAFAGVQAVSLGGVVPLDTAPDLVRRLAAVVPMASAGDALVAVGLGGPGPVVADLVVLVLWGAAAFGLSALAARRAQQVDVADLGGARLLGASA